MTSDKIWDPSIFDNDIDPNDPSFVENSRHLLHLLPHQDYDLEGYYIRSHGTDHQASSPSTDLGFGTDDDPSDTIRKNDIVDFDDFVAANLFEDAVQFEDDTEELFFDPENEEDAAFWLNEAEYQHNECVARCVNAAIRENALSFEFDDGACTLDMSEIDNLDVYEVNEIKLLANGSPRIHMPSKIDYENMRPYFGWLPLEIIKEKFKDSTQYGYMPSSSLGNLFKRFKVPNPAMNVFRLNEDALTDTVYADTPALDYGHTLAQIFFGSNSHIAAVYGIKSTKNFLQTLQDFVRKWGAPNRVIADHAY